VKRFTLIEYGIAVVIIILIASMVVPALFMSQKKKEELVPPPESAVVFRYDRGNTGPYSDIMVLKFEYEGESYLVCSKGGLVHIEKGKN
jgi:hypothetical protein